jgi:CHASE3 domain sensor protein
VPGSRPAGLLLLSLSLLVWAGEMSRRERFDLRRWLPLTGSIILMVVVAALAGISMHQLRASYSSRSATYATLVSAQNLLGGVTDIMRGARSYALSGQAEALQIYEKGRQAIPSALTELAQKTRKNPDLEPLVEPLTADFDAVIAYAGRLIESRNSAGLQELWI